MKRRTVMTLVLTLVAAVIVQLPASVQAGESSFDFYGLYIELRTDPLDTIAVGESATVSVRVENNTGNDIPIEIGIGLIVVFDNELEGIPSSFPDECSAFNPRYVSCDIGSMLDGTAVDFSFDAVALAAAEDVGILAGTSSPVYIVSTETTIDIVDPPDISLQANLTDTECAVLDSIAAGIGVSRQETIVRIVDLLGALVVGIDPASVPRADSLPLAPPDLPCQFSVEWPADHAAELDALADALGIARDGLPEFATQFIIDVIRAILTGG